MSVTRMEDGVFVTRSDAADAALYPSPPPPPPIVPQSVTRLQGRLALNAAGLLTKVESAVAATDPATQIWYQDADHWDRQDPHVMSLAVTIGLNSDQVDALFTQAATL